MAKEYIAAFKDGSDYSTYAGSSLQSARGEIDFADAYEEFIEAQQNTHAKPVMLMREYGRPWRKMTSSEMRQAAQ